MENMENQENQDIIIKGRVSLAWQMFPKGGTPINSGDFGIISANVINITEGEPKISNRGTITLTGNMCAMNKDEEYKIIAKEVTNEKFGVQYQIVYIGTDMKLDSVNDQKLFLSNILTEKQCFDLFAMYESPIDLLANRNVEALCKIKGIAPLTALKLIEKYENNIDYSEIYVKLDRYGLTKKAVQRLMARYGSPSIVVSKVEANPYILIDEVDGFGWGKADQLALAGGVMPHSIIRVKAYIKYYLNEEANNGNTYCWIDDLLENIDSVIGYDLPQENLSEALRELRLKKKIWTNEKQEIIALSQHYNLERNIAVEINRLIKSPNNFAFEGWENKVSKLEERQGWCFTEEQRGGVKTILENQVVIVQGLAGTGKTTTVLGMLEVFGDEYSFAQCALSGRASCNLSDVTGIEGYTIHRLLGFSPEGGFEYNAKSPLSTDIIILDEVSMVGAEIFFSLIQAIKDGAKLIMLGDHGQLASIGIANIFSDMISSGAIPIVNLTKIHRQASKSAVITEGKNIYEQVQITEKNFVGVEVRGELQDLELDIYNDKELTHDRVVSHFKSLMKVADSYFDIQIVVPMKERGGSSAYPLNNSIQALVMDRSRRSLIVGEGTTYPFAIFVGDKVMNTKNNYSLKNEYGADTPIFNGDLGVVKYIDYDKRTLLVEFKNKGSVYISSDHLIYMKLGYAVTCHKIQGSSSPYVICAVDNSSWTMLCKELLYTMLTRTKKYCVLCAENKALRMAISKSDVKDKQTFLKVFLTGELSTDRVA